MEDPLDKLYLSDSAPPRFCKERRSTSFVEAQFLHKDRNSAHNKADAHVGAARRNAPTGTAGEENC